MYTGNDGTYVATTDDGILHNSNYITVIFIEMMSALRMLYGAKVCDLRSI